MLNAFNDVWSLLHYDFMQHALWAGACIAVLAGAVGYFVVLRQVSFAAHALSHIGFAGASAAILLSLHPLWGQLILTLAAGIVMAWMPSHLARKDTVIGLVLAFALGLGSLFLFLANGFAGSASHILFGDLLSVSATNVWLMFGLSVVSLSVLLIFSRALWLSSLLPEIAAARGLPLRGVNIVFFVVLSIAITLASQAVGILLIFTLLVGPPAMALQLTGRFWPGLLLSIAFNLLFIWLALLFASVSDWPLSFWLSGLVFVTYGLMWGMGKR